MGLLGDIFSAIDTKKRQVKGLLDDFGGTVDMGVRRFREDQQNLQNLFANAYPMAGDKTVLNSPQQIAQFQREAADKAGEMGLAGATAGKFVYPQGKALETAQRNAAKPIKEGGLGLPANNTPMDRAKAMGFDTDAYHGTNRQFDSFSNDMLGVKTGANSAKKAHFLAANPELSNGYVGLGHVNSTNIPVYEKLVNNKQAWQDFNNAATDADKWAVLERNGLNLSHGQVMPVSVNLGNARVKDYKGQGYRDTTFNDELKAAKRGKKDSVVFKNTYDPGPHEASNVMSDVYAIPDPKNIRSRFAAFDPARRNESDILGRASPELLKLLAGGTAGGLLGYNALKD